MTLLTNQEYDRRSQFAPIVTSTPPLGTTQGQPPARAVHVRLEKLATGCWSVQAVACGRGGLFRDYASATKFIRREFTARQQTVVEMLPA
jgi:hypothetical protein